MWPCWDCTERLSCRDPGPQSHRQQTGAALGRHCQDMNAQRFPRPQRRSLEASAWPSAHAGTRRTRKPRHVHLPMPGWQAAGAAWPAAEDTANTPAAGWQRCGRHMGWVYCTGQSELKLSICILSAIRSWNMAAVVCSLCLIINHSYVFCDFSAGYFRHPRTLFTLVH